MEEKKMLCSDLDGTLLTDNKEISQKNIDAINRMLSEGHYFVISTGRPVASGREIVKQLGLTKSGCYMIAFNGAVIYDCAADRILFQRSLPIEYVQEIFQSAKEKNLYVQTYTSTDVVTYEHTRELDFYLKNSGIKSYKLSSKIYDVLEEEPQKVLLIDLEQEERLKEFQKEKLAWEKGKCHSFFSCKEYLEYCPLGVSKGYGVEYLAQLLNLSIDQIVAVGDERNDIPMLQAAKIGVAMANAVDEVKKAADCVTKNDNNHDAIAEIIENYILG